MHWQTSLLLPRRIRSVRTGTGKPIRIDASVHSLPFRTMTPKNGWVCIEKKKRNSDARYTGHKSCRLHTQEWIACSGRSDALCIIEEASSVEGGNSGLVTRVRRVYGGTFDRADMARELFSPPSRIMQSRFPGSHAVRAESSCWRGRIAPFLSPLP